MTTLQIITILLLAVDLFFILKGRGLIFKLARKLDEAVRESEKNN